MSHMIGFLLCLEAFLEKSKKVPFWGQETQTQKMCFSLQNSKRVLQIVMCSQTSSGNQQNHIMAAEEDNLVIKKNPKKTPQNSFLKKPETKTFFSRTEQN